MKQHITKEQWDELSDEQKKVWYGKVLPYAIPEYCLGIQEAILPSIGQMVEFLGDSCQAEKEEYYFAPKIDTCYHNGKYNYNTNNDEVVINWEGELADALWEVVKEKLNK